MTFQYGLDDAALHAFPPPVDQPHLDEAGLVRGLQILVYDRGDVAWMKRVQVYGVFDRYSTQWEMGNGKW